MNREALEAQLKALMDEAIPKDSQKTEPKTDTPKASPGKARMAALIVGGALFGALISGFLRPAPVPPSAASELVETLEGPGKETKIDASLIYMGVARYRE